MQASDLYPISDPEYVFAHQFWASCTLFQLTQEEAFWNQTEALYLRWINNGEEGIDRLFFPVANFDNPVFYGLLCMAQSAPSATGFETLSGLEAAALADQETLLLTQPPLNATRLDAVNQLWNNFVSVWLGAIEGENSVVACAPLSFAPKVFRVSLKLFGACLSQRIQSVSKVVWSVPLPTHLARSDMRVARGRVLSNSPADDGGPVSHRGVCVQADGRQQQPASLRQHQRQPDRPSARHAAGLGKRRVDHHDVCRPARRAADPC